VNTCYYLISHLAHVVEQSKGMTTIGGMVTYSASKFGLDDRLHQFKPIKDLEIFYLDFCVHMYKIKLTDNTSTRFIS